MSDPIVEVLERIETAVRAGSVPVTHRWIGMTEIGDMLGYSVTHVAQRIVCLPDFPKPARVGGRGDPRWPIADVQAWMQSQRKQ